MQKTNTCKLGVIILALAMLATAFAVLPTMGAGKATNESVNAEITYTIKGKVVQTNPSGPISDVKVSLNNSDSTDTTDAQGYFELYVARDPNVNTTVIFKHPTFMTVSKEVNTTQYVGTVANMQNTTMKKLSSVSGVVKTRAGIYIGDVNVTVVDDSTGLAEGWAVTSSVGAFTVYVDATDITVTYRKVGYYEGLGEYSLTPSTNTNAGTIYLDTIVPTPTVLLFGVVSNAAGGAGISGVHVSVSRDGVNWISNVTDAQGYYEILTYSGRFMVKAELKGFYTYEDWADVPEGERFNFNVELDATPVETNTLTGKVERVGTLDDIQGATVKLYDTAGNYVNGTETDASGDYTIMFYDATFKLAVSMDGYFINSQYNITNATTTQNVLLTPVPQDRTLSGRIITIDNYKIIGATVTIYDKAKIYTNSTTSVDPNGFYTIRVYPGTFAVLVNAAGFQGKMSSVTVGATDKTMDIALDESSNDTITTTYEFSADWMNVTYSQSRILSVDNATLRANADIEHGRGTLGLTVNDWTVETAEVDSWTEFMEAQGLPDLYTTDIFALDNKHYEMDTDTYTVTISNAEGAVETSTDAILVDIVATYTIAGDVKDGTNHVVSLNASYDEANLDNIYQVVLPYGYEMVSNTTMTGSVEVTGFTTIVADTMVSDGIEKMTMSVKLSDNGTARMRLTDGTFYEKNTTHEGYEIIVRAADATGANSTVEFSAADSTDPVGMIALANFTWNFGDGSALDYGMTVTHNYSVAGTYVVKLNVTETGGNHTWHNATVLVDAADPTAVVNVLYRTIASAAITIEEDNKTAFTGGNSTDMITGSTAGIIQTWQWSWGDGTVNETVTKGGEANINHTYSNPGKYYVLMNVTDVVGHVSADYNLTVNVKDITKPDSDYVIKNVTYIVVTGCRENTTFYFNSTSTDNYDTWGNLTYTWSWGDGTANETGMNLTHNFTKMGSFNVTLNVTDAAGNWAVKMTSVVVSLGIRPNLVLYANTLDLPVTIDQGDNADLSVNFTNKGEATATGTTVKFYIRESDGDNKLISGTVTFYDKDGNTVDGTVEVNENVTAKMSWKPSSKGNYTIYATANCTEEHPTTSYDNNNGATLATSYVKVNESPMTQIIIVVIAVVAFVVIAAVYFFWMRGKTSGGSVDDKRKKK